MAFNLRRKGDETRYRPKVTRMTETVMRRRGARLNIKPEFLTAFHGDLIDSLLEGFGPASAARDRCPRKLASTKSRGVQTSPSSTREELLAKRDRILQCTGIQLDAELGVPKKGLQRRIEGQRYRQGNAATTSRMKSRSPPSLPPLLLPTPSPPQSSLIPAPPPGSLPSLLPPAAATPRANPDTHMTLKMDFESASATLSGRLVYKNKLGDISSQKGSMENDARTLSMELATSLEKVLTKLVKAEDSCCETRVSVFMGDDDAQEKTRARRLPPKGRARQQNWNTPYNRRVAGTLAKNKRSRLLKPGHQNDRVGRKIWS